MKTRARIISIENPASKPVVNPECTHYLHSKFVKRKRYVLNVLLPQVTRIMETELFPAVTQEDFTVERGQVVYNGICLTVGNGVVGNFISHLMLWVSCEGPLLILEDDAALRRKNRSNVMRAIRSFEGYARPAVLHLLSAVPSLKFGVKSFRDYTEVDDLLRLTSAGDLSGTAAYCVNPLGAEALARAATQWKTQPTDGFIHHAFDRGEIDVLVPADHGNCFTLHQHFASWNHVHHA